MPQIDFGKPDGAIGVEIVLHYGARCFQGFSDALYDIQDPPAKHTNPARNFHRITDAMMTTPRIFRYIGNDRPLLYKRC